MTIDWKAQSISISKRWNDKKKKRHDEPSSTVDETTTTDTTTTTQEESTETGTRYYSHAFFVVHLLLQIANAGIQHLQTPMYLVYITILHGPCLLFIVWVAQIFQQVMAKKCFRLQESRFDVVLSPMGSLTMHDTSTVGQDAKVSLMLPVVYALLCFFWVVLYAIFDGAAFDETITNGVDFDELDSVWGILANVSAQAVFVCLYLVALNLIVPVFPLSGASFFAAGLAWQGLGVRATAIIMDVFGALTSILLIVVGAQQTFFNDGNGIGVFTLFNALILAALCFKRRCLDPLEEHELVTRPCYSEKEVISNPDGAEATESSSSNDVTEGNEDGDEGDMQDLELV